MKREELECRLYCVHPCHRYETTGIVKIKSNGKKEEGVIYIGSNVNKNFLEKIMSRKCLHCSNFGMEINGRVIKGNGNGLEHYKFKLEI